MLPPDSLRDTPLGLVISDWSLSPDLLVRSRSRSIASRGTEPLPRSLCSDSTPYSVLRVWILDLLIDFRVTLSVNCQLVIFHPYLSFLNELLQPCARYISHCLGKRQPWLRLFAASNEHSGLGPLLTLGSSFLIAISIVTTEAAGERSKKLTVRETGRKSRLFVCLQALPSPLLLCSPLECNNHNSVPTIWIGMRAWAMYP